MNLENTSTDRELILRQGSVTVDIRRYQVFISECQIDLTSSEFHILVKLIRNPGWVITREELLNHLHGNNFAISGRSIDFLVFSIRKKFGTSKYLIETVRGIGYRFLEKI